MIIFVQPIFAPNQELLDKNISSIRSIKNIINTNYDIKFLFGGWTINDEYWDTIVNEINGLNIIYSIKRFDKNYGKAFVVNDLLLNQLEGYTYILTCDSDIIFKDNTNYIERLISVDTVFCKTYNYTLGVIGLNQEIGNCHMIEYLSQNSVNFNGVENENIIWNNYAGGIGGGCFFTTTNMWRKCNGYKTMGVYAGDDAYYLLDCKNNGGFVGMFNSLSVIHPYETNSKYQEWKVKVCQRDSNPHKSLNDSHIHEADEFWKD